MADAIVVGTGEGERIARANVSDHRVLAELPELEAIELTFEAGWEGVGPHTHADHVVHGFSNPGPGRIRVLNIHAPNTGFVERVRRR